MGFEGLTRNTGPRSQTGTDTAAFQQGWQAFSSATQPPPCQANAYCDSIKSQPDSWRFCWEQFLQRDCLEVKFWCLQVIPQVIPSLPVEARLELRSKVLCWLRRPPPRPGPLAGCFRAMPHAAGALLRQSGPDSMRDVAPGEPEPEGFQKEELQRRGCACSARSSLVAFQICMALLLR